MRLVAKIFGLLGLSVAGSVAPTEAATYTLAPIYLDLRNKALGTTAQSIGAKEPVYGVLMETGYPEAAITLVAMADGSASLYFSTGGGMIGAGQHTEPAAAARSLIAFAAYHLSKLQPTVDKPLPVPGRVRFYVLTTSGLLTAEASESDLGNNRHALSPLFYSAQDLISEMRKVEEKRK
ncbi:MAG: hypothetical protein IT482_14165 [Gammaproteobacteria bacterium]|nr:hypothetical protein [Gammaproteobacteria bacterium]